MCENWKFNDYCTVANSPNLSTLYSNKTKSLQNIGSRSNKNNYYNDDHVYLLASIQMNFTDHVSTLYIVLCF